MSKSVLIVAAEASSALYAQRLLEYWNKKTSSGIKCYGVGSKEMANLGFERFGKSEEMAVVGLAEIIEHYKDIKAVFNKLLEVTKDKKPQLAILMDYPEFNLKLAKELHRLGIPVVYYISPQVWAWRKGRVKTIKKYCNKVYVLFPFEVDFYKGQGVPVEFIGHPLLDEIEDKYLPSSQKSISDDLHNKFLKQKRQSYGLEENEIVIGLMPGSRRSELNLNLEVQLQTAELLYNHYKKRELEKGAPEGFQKKLRFALLVAPSFSKEDLQERLQKVQAIKQTETHYPLILVKDEPFEMISLCDFILVASGTAVLQVGLLQKPMVIMYRLKWITALLARLIVRGVRFFGIVNLILGYEAVPERWQAGADPDQLFLLMKKYIDDSEYTNKVISSLADLQKNLGSKGATSRLAEALERDFLKGTQDSL